MEEADWHCQRPWPVIPDSFSAYQSPHSCCYHSLLWLFVLQLLTRVLLREVLLLLVIELVWTWCCIWKIPWTEEPGRLQSMGSRRVGHDWETSLSLIGEGNGNPLQCSCLENPRDGGAWWASVYGVTQSRTRLKRLSTSEGSEGSHCLALLELEVKCQDCPAPAQVGGVEHTLGGSKTSLDTTLRASAPAPWDPPIPLIGWWWPLSLGGTLFHTWLWPLTLATSPTKATWESPATPGEDVTIFISDLVPSTKPQRICRLHRDTHTQRHPFKIRTGNCFTFHRDRKKFKNWKDRGICFKWKNKNCPLPHPRKNT